MSKRTNFYNAFCRNCPAFVYKGKGVWHAFNGGTVLCRDCDEKRDKKIARNKAIKANVKKAKTKKAYLDSLPTLFDNIKGENS